MSDEQHWTELDAAGRAEYVTRACQEGRWLSVIRPGTTEATLDLLAAFRAVCDDDMDGLAAILTNGNLGLMLIASLKMLAEVCSEQEIDPTFMSVWATHVMERSS